MIEARADALGELIGSDGASATVCLVGYLYDSAPGLTLSNELLRKLVDLGVAVDTDLYVMEEGVSLISKDGSRSDADRQT